MLLDLFENFHEARATDISSPVFEWSEMNVYLMAKKRKKNWRTFSKVFCILSLGKKKYSDELVFVRLGGNRALKG